MSAPAPCRPARRDASSPAPAGEAEPAPQRDEACRAAPGRGVQMHVDTPDASAMISAMACYGGIDLGGTKIQAVDRRRAAPGARLGASADADERRTGRRGRRDGGRAARRRERRGGRSGDARGGRRRLARHDRGRHRDERAQPARLGRQLPAGPDARTGARLSGEARQRRAGGHRRRVQARRGQAVRVAARRVLGYRRRRRPGRRRAPMDRAWRGRRDRPHRRRARRRAVHVWAPRLHGGLCRALGDGSARRQADREGQGDRPVQADEGAQALAPDEWHLGARARSRATSSPST